MPVAGAAAAQERPARNAAPGTGHAVALTGGEILGHSERKSIGKDPAGGAVATAGRAPVGGIGSAAGKLKKRRPGEGDTPGRRQRRGAWCPLRPHRFVRSASASRPISKPASSSARRRLPAASRPPSLAARRSRTRSLAAATRWRSRSSGSVGALTGGAARCRCVIASLRTLALTFGFDDGQHALHAHMHRAAELVREQAHHVGGQ